MEHNTLERYGFLIKKSNLSSISKTINSKYLVIKEDEPFHGYYQYISKEKKPFYIYLILKTFYTFEQVTRVSQKVKKVFKKKFEATLGTIRFSNEELHVIRIRHIEQYEIANDLIELYKREGLLFQDYKKNITNKSGIIKLKKFFFLNLVAENIYLDTQEPYHGYFHFPTSVSWEDFEKLTQKVQFNWERSKFDAALGCLYIHAGLHDIVRIYNLKVDADYLIECKKLFDRGIKY